MSFDALSWAARCNPRSSAKKLVLLALAECASREGNTAYPSIAAIAEFTSLNRKTIIAALDALEHDGFIHDSGERVGKTKQVKVYILAVGTVPKTEQFQNRNSTVFSVKEYRKRDTEPVREQVRYNNVSARAKKPIAAKPDDVTLQVWDDFIDLRKIKRAPLTETALAGIRREAEKAGWPLQDVLSECCGRGWQGFKAEWVKKDNGDERKNIRTSNTNGADKRSSLARACDEALDFLG